MLSSKPKRSRRIAVINPTIHGHKVASLLNPIRSKADGVLVGLRVGNLVGCQVGDMGGSSVAMFAAFNVGEFVRPDVGDILGSQVGELVWSLVEEFARIKVGVGGHEGI